MRFKAHYIHQTFIRKSLPMKYSFILLLLFSIIQSNSQTTSEQIPNTKFANGISALSPIFRPYWADMHSTITRGEVAIALNSVEYDYANKGDIYKPFVFANIGADLPLWSGFFRDKKFGFGVTLPFFVDVWLDMFERTTAPVINSAYRFGLPEFMFYHKLDKKFMGIKNYSIRLSPMKHECTHIGDELTIYRKEMGFPLTRVNVSYNYAELGITINDPLDSKARNHSFRYSIMILHDFSQGWYSILPNEGDTQLVVPSKIPIESYLQYQYQSNVGKKSHLQAIMSAEVRYRSKYGYASFFNFTGKYDSERMDDLLQMPEYKAAGVNLMFGARYINPKLYGYKIGVAFRGYLGVNPYGQFRSTPFYNQLGICLLFEQ
ncbi:hypothetical protein BN938_0625 [Mucinivorans hirudinis]|uniref:Uncharacterized protein n=1 Tax=Mucinivorans hirudinis TaxID=1433126 RepID=A0A060R6Q2_9BACT|nr:hypothetical protein BN938_0625 [Mucinivorans hirudinis]